MAYSEFLNLRQVEKKLGLKTADISLFPMPVPTVAVSQRLIDDINYAKLMPLMSEKAKAELVITPIFKEVKLSKQIFNYFSGYTIRLHLSFTLKLSRL